MEEGTEMKTQLRGGRIGWITWTLNPCSRVKLPGSSPFFNAA